MIKNSSKCIDINSKYCPCLLAETNQCVFCSHLKGEMTCNCNWSGMCILYEKHWQHKKQHQGEESPKTRIEEEVSFNIKEQLSDNTYRLEMQVSAELATQLALLGSFVFLRAALGVEGRGPSPRVLFPDFPPPHGNPLFQAR